MMARVVDMQSQRDCIPLVEIMKIVVLSNNQRICAAMMEVAIQRMGHPEIKVQWMWNVRLTERVAQRPP